MSDVIDELREAAEPVPVPLELPDEEQLVLVEEELSLALPGTVREYMLTVSDVVLGHLEPVTIADPRSHTWLPEVAARAWNDGLPRDLLPICETTDGYWCCDQHGLVRFWDYSGEIGDDEWSSIWDWAEKVWLPTA